MQHITLHLPKDHQERYLKSIAGHPTYLTAKYNLATVVMSVLKEPPLFPHTYSDFEIKVYLPDWAQPILKQKNYLSPTANKFIGDYIDSLLDVDFYNFMKPYHLNERLDIKDGINLFIDKRNLPEDLRVYEMLKKRDYRLRKKICVDNPAEFFNHLSPA